jgi:hypothetical protein
MAAFLAVTAVNAAATAADLETSMVVMAAGVAARN